MCPDEDALSRFEWPECEVMTRFRRSPPPISRRTAETLLDVQQRQTIARMLDAGGIATPIGPNTIIRLATGGVGTFPTPLYEAVVAARLRSSPGAEP